MSIAAGDKDDHDAEPGNGWDRALLDYRRGRREREREKKALQDSAVGFPQVEMCRPKALYAAPEGPVC